MGTEKLPTFLSKLPAFFSLDICRRHVFEAEKEYSDAVLECVEINGRDTDFEDLRQEVIDARQALDVAEHESLRWLRGWVKNER